MQWFLGWPRIALTLRQIKDGSALGPRPEVNNFQDLILPLLTRYRVLALSCFSFIWSDVLLEIWNALRAMFFFLIESLISSLHQGTWFFLREFVDFPIEISAALIMESEINVISSSIEVVSDWVFSSMKVSTRLEKNPQSGFFNNHLGVEDGDRVLVESRGHKNR